MFRYLIPIFLNLALVPIWFAIKKTWTVSILYGLINVIVLPIYLLIILYPSLNIRLSSFLKGGCLNFCISLCGSFVEYITWGIYTGYLYEPDSETIHILKVQILASMIVFVASSAAIYTIKKWRNTGT